MNDLNTVKKLLKENKNLECEIHNRETHFELNINNVANKASSTLRDVIEYLSAYGFIHIRHQFNETPFNKNLIIETKKGGAAWEKMKIIILIIIVIIVFIISQLRK